MKLMTKILLPTDFSAAADNALQTAIPLAKAFHSDVTLFYAIAIPWDVPRELDKVKAEATRKLKERQDILAQEGVSVSEIIVEVGDPFELIRDYANKHAINVIMMGYDVSEEKAKRSPGIKAGRLMRKTDKPIWVVKKGVTPPIHKILCPVDFSESSARALRNGIHLSRQLVAELTVLYVVERESNLDVGVRMKPAEFLEEHPRSEEERFDLFLQKFDFSNIKWHKEIQHGDPCERILATAGQMRSDLLIMGSIGKTGLPWVLLGSTATNIIKAMPCSIITLKAEDAIQIELNLESGDLDTHIRQGYALLEQGLSQEALGEFEKCLTIDDMCFRAWEGKAYAFERHGKETWVENCREQAKNIRYRLWAREVEMDIRGNFTFGEKG